MKKAFINAIVRDIKDGSSVREIMHEYHLSSTELFQKLRRARWQRLLTEGDIQGIILNKEANRFPINSESRLEAILRSMNNELKLAALLTIREYETGNDIARKLRKSTSVSIPTGKSFNNYFLETLVPSGLVVMYEFDSELFPFLRSKQFSLSEIGKKYGRPIAAFSLKYAVDNNVSLATLLGETSSSGKHSPAYVRARMLELILEGKNTIPQIVKELNIRYNAVEGHLKQMEQLGIVNYKTENHKLGYNPYTWKEGKELSEVNIVLDLTYATEDVSKWLFEHKEGTARQIASELGYVPGTVSRVLTGLTDQGFAESPFSIILLEKHTLLNDYIKSIRNALSGGPELKEMTREWLEFMRDKSMYNQYIESGIELYTSVSPNLNPEGTEVRMIRILNCIIEFHKAEGRGPRPIEMTEPLGLKKSALSPYLHLLHEEGFVQREKVGTSTFYTPVNV